MLGSVSRVSFIDWINIQCVIIKYASNVMLRRKGNRLGCESRNSLNNLVKPQVKEKQSALVVCKKGNGTNSQSLLW